MGGLMQGQGWIAARFCCWLALATCLINCNTKLIQQVIDDEDTTIDGGPGAGSGGDGSGGGGSGATFTAIGTVAGTIAPTSSLGGGQKYGFLMQSGQNNTCANASVQGFLVGSGSINPSIVGAAVDGNFSLTWSEPASSPTATASEIVLVFACDTGVGSTLRCFGKPGDARLSCDAITNAIVTAFETSLGESITASRLFSGLSIAKIVQGMVETLKLLSRLNPSQDYVAQLTAATSEQELLAIIEGSPINTLLLSIQGMADAVKKQNQALQAGQSTAQALSSAWDVGKIIEILVGAGMEIRLQLEEGRGDGDLAVYSQLADRIDAMTSVAFHPEIRTYLDGLYDRLYGPQPISNPSVVFVCQANKNNGAAIVYAPDKDVNFGSGSVAAYSCFGPKALSLGLIEQIGDMPNDGYIETYLRQPVVEKDRNIPDGGSYFVRPDAFRLQIELVEVFPEFIQYALNPNGICGQFLDASINEGPPGPATDWDNLTACVKANQFDVYFSGVLGIYRFLTVPELADLRISLDDIYQTLLDEMSVRLSINDDMFQTFQYLTVDPGPEQFGVSLQPLLFDQNEIDPNSQLPIYMVQCPPAYCDQNGMPWTQEISLSQFNSIMNQSRPSKQILFGDFLTVPAVDSIKETIFNASHHVPYNTIGNRYFHVVGKDVDQDGRTDVPLMCAMWHNTTGKLMSSYTRGVTRISCQIAQGTWIDGQQDPNSQDYTGWYGLIIRTSNENARYFGLLDLYTGYELTVGGKPLRLRDISGFAAGTQLDGSGNLLDANGNTLYETFERFCFDVVNVSGELQKDCRNEEFYFVSLDFPNQNDGSQMTTPAQSFYEPVFYQPYSSDYPILIYDAMTGSSYTQRMQVAMTNGVLNEGFDFSQGYPLCIPQGRIEFDQDGFASFQDPIDDPVIQDCRLLASNAQQGDPQASNYYLLTLDWFLNKDANNAAEYVYTIIRSNGTGLYAYDGGVLGCDAQTPWNCPRLTLGLPEVRSYLNNLQVGPTQAYMYMPHFQVQNKSFDGRYDPYCDDQDGDGYCDCYRDVDGDGIYELHLHATSNPSASQCSLNDKAGDERTLSELPFPPNMPGMGMVWAVMAACGNTSGEALNLCLSEQSELGLQLDGQPLPLERLFACANSSTNQQPKYIDRQHLFGQAPVPDVNLIGGDCDGRSPGPVRMIRFSKRRNAFDIARPQTAIQLLATALQNLGTGTQIAMGDNIFSYQDALAMLMYRLQLPVNQIAVVGPDRRLPAGQNLSEFFVPLPGLSSQFTRIDVSNQRVSSNAPGAILRKFLQKGNLLPTQPG